ncbi:MAG TPA: DUF429 domain-containing protein [Actinomycetota bacterium]|jgi:predicted nuclease with RNAse H fold|nr:DUF429 domain-containing protein [Actinomycetota bacterium]
MRTAGIDLAAAPANTAACVLDWTAVPARPVSLEKGLSDDDLLALTEGVAKVGIDCPLGWPRDFVRMVGSHAAGRAPGPLDRSRLLYRATDRHVARTGRAPLSVSTDRIGVTAIRCAGLLARMKESGREVTRDGSGDVAEVYPAAALRAAGLDCRRYKGAGGAQARRRLTRELLELAQGALRLEVELTAQSDHLFDAVVCATVAGAVVAGLTELPPAEHHDEALEEGWIHVPVRGALSRVGLALRRS